MKALAGASALGNLASAIGIHGEESSVVAELKAGSEEAFSWLIAHYHQEVYSLVYRMVNDPADAADTVQDVFIKVFRGIKRFHGESSLKTWIYRIAVHEASNRRRWWSRHKGKEVTIEADSAGLEEGVALGYKDTLPDRTQSPFECAMHEEVRANVETELALVNEPYRTTVILRDIEDLSYEEIAEVTGASLGTVKSRLMRGRQALKKRLEQYVKQHGAELGISAGAEKKQAAPERAPVAHAVEVVK